MGRRLRKFFFSLFLCRVQKRIHHRGYKQRHKEADAQAADKSLADGLNCLRARSGEKGDGEHGKYCCQACHHNGAKPVAARLKARFAQLQAARAQSVGIVYQYDAVVYNHSDQGDNAHYRKHGHRLAADFVNPDNPDKQKGNRKEDDQRVNERFKLACHNAEDQEHGGSYD